jgi:hypothetical protein|tara:strand:+ start:1342 stop:1860 length:519 start_codon:yes stop_codon:yes gene_type:complete
MNIEEFKSRLGAGGARPNQFRVKLAFPSYVTGVDPSYSLLVTGASLPASNVNPAIIQYRGREIKLAGERIFDPWTITVVNDSDFSLRAPFEAWMNGMNDRATNEGITLSPSQYQSDIVVEHLDRNDTVLANGSYTLRNAFPIQMSEIALNYAQNDIFEEFTVTWQYTHYDVV